MTMNAPALTIVLIHGGFVDGSGWEGVYNILKKDGYDVAVVQNPTTSLADDVAFTKRVIARSRASRCWWATPTAESSSPKRARIPKVAGLVYVAAFAPDKGESVASLIKNPPPGAPVPPILPPQDGFLLLDQAKFNESFAGDVDGQKASFMAASQVPWGVAALAGEVTAPAWKTKPSWYLVATNDKMIPPPAQRQMSQRAGAVVTETPGSHAVYVSQPGAVADLIKKAAAAVST